MTDKIGVAISTTGDLHRMPLLGACVERWAKALPRGSSLFVTVDGDEKAATRVARLLTDWPNTVYRVGQGADVRDGRMGVAVNKNTGIELLMDSSVGHLFLSDDDTWPLHRASLGKHTSFDSPHSMVCWGKSRLVGMTLDGHADWRWPRGVMLYQQRAVIEQIGGMDERFGLGGHEHAEFSRRAHQAGITPVLFPTPQSYVTRNATGARALWHCEDMKRPGEALHELGERRKRLTTIDATKRDWEQINAVMAERDGDTSKVPYQAYMNGRESATLYRN